MKVIPETCRAHYIRYLRFVLLNRVDPHHTCVEMEVEEVDDEFNNN